MVIQLEVGLPIHHSLYALDGLSVPYLCGLCWAVLGLDLEEGLGAKRGPGPQGQVGCPWLWKRQ